LSASLLARGKGRLDGGAGRRRPAVAVARALDSGLAFSGRQATLGSAMILISFV
jgi:hypothetical protein